jgi:deoxyribonuclease V
MEQEYINIQESLSQKVIKQDDSEVVRYIAGVDVAYEKEGDKVIAGITVLDAATLNLLETSTHSEQVRFPYIPGLFSFRELPPVLKAFEKLKMKPDLIVCDGHGYAHPRRFGLACHLGVGLGIPTIGCAKKRLIGEYVEPGISRGNYSELKDKDETIGRVLRTQDNIKPVFVSIGHKISLETASEWVLKLCLKYRLPETTRTADHAVNMAMKEFTK